ncbi:MAG: hypothetical protein QOC81_893 [Thermoanaerobaculia bacterium]|nr:hypothetical protein [Thermoanaerobaculia bacterium]
MKRNVTEVLRRGLDTTIANWPVILLRIVESLVFAAIVIAGVLAAIVPAIVAAGLSVDDIRNSSDPGGAVVEWVIGHLMLFVWMFALAFIVFGIMIAIHSFIEGASARIYVDAERAAAKRPAAVRDDFAVFSFDRWLAGGGASWWRIFWVYNLAWSVSLLLVLVPLVLTATLMLVISNNVGRVIVGCAGLALALLILIPTAIVTSIWCRKAIAICVARAIGANDALRAGWREFRADLGRHLAVAVIIIVISMALNSLVSGFSVPMNLTQNKFPTFALMFAPARVIAGVVQGVIGAAISSFFLACFVSMTEER